MSVAACACLVKAGAVGAKGPERVTWEVLYMESRCAPKRIEKFFGMTPVVVLGSPPTGGSEKGTNHLASVFASSCQRIARGKVWRPYSFLVFEPLCRAEWNTLGLAIENRIERHRAELGAMVPTR